MMVDAGSASSVDYMRHDAETFRVAEELMMLSSCVPSADKLTSSPSNISGFFDHTVKEEIMTQSPERSRGTASIHRYDCLRRRLTASEWMQSNINRYYVNDPLSKRLEPAFGTSSRSQHKIPARIGTKKGKKHVNVKMEVSVPSRPLHDNQDILNSQCDVSHSVLLQEHRSRCRRARRRWNIAHNSKVREYVERYMVQGVPLVQHLEALAHSRAVN